MEWVWIGGAALLVLGGVAVFALRGRSVSPVLPKIVPSQPPPSTTEHRSGKVRARHLPGGVRGRPEIAAPPPPPRVTAADILERIRRKVGGTYRIVPTSDAHGALLKRVLWEHPDQTVSKGEGSTTRAAVEALAIQLGVDPR